ncbi:Unknown protein [Striga hermonthica]|uniref:Uncharacterized protein n=1 Tax=Striga hermonthica TaxID=68872 RepID=A0A9N7NID6_STRHE|nr:Unknown protein [Striga hermonthica]
MRSSRAKYYGTLEGIERRPRIKSSADGLPRKRSPKKDGISVLKKHETKSPAEQKRSKRSKAPLYKDPFASSKLEMLKNIRAQRAASVDKQSVAITRARLLIAEAEKAVQALETAAKTNPYAEASVIESRMLISEAQQIIKSIEAQETVLFENGNNLSENSTARVPTLKHVADPNVQEPLLFKHVKVNGVESNFEKLSPNDSVETGENLFHLTSSNGHISLPSKDLDAVEENLNGSSRLDCTSENLEGRNRQIKLAEECKSEKLEGPEKQIKSTKKKWVRGRLVEVEEC